MLKIRDLGINVIPITMRPPEIGPGGGFEMAVAPANDPATCVQETNCVDETCDPSGQCIPSCEQGSQAPRGYQAGGFSQDAIAQLKQQLQSHIGQLEN